MFFGHVFSVSCVCLIFVKNNMVQQTLKNQYLGLLLYLSENGDNIQVYIPGCTYFSFHSCSDLGVGGWVIGNPNIVRIFKIRTQKWTVPYSTLLKQYYLNKYFRLLLVALTFQAVLVHQLKRWFRCTLQSETFQPHNSLTW